MKLINKAGQTVCVGDTVMSLRGNPLTVQFIDPPTHAGDGGYITSELGRHLPSICGLAWVADEIEEAAPAKPFSVLLLYPDFITSDYGEETILSHVTARNVDEAIAAAQREIGGDFYALAVFAGHLQDLKP